MSSMRTCKNAIVATLMLACTATATAAPTADTSVIAKTTAQYLDLSDQLRTDAEIETWYGAMHHLRRNFDDICGDTFCEGDYSNIYALRFRCSVNAATQVIGQCMWIFAASNEEVDEASGRIAVQPKVWRCVLPLTPRTSSSALLGALARAGDEPLYATLPGSNKTLYDGLMDCL